MQSPTSAITQCTSGSELKISRHKNRQKCLRPCSINWICQIQLECGACRSHNLGLAVQSACQHHSSIKRLDDVGLEVSVRPFEPSDRARAATDGCANHALLFNSFFLHVEKNTHCWRTFTGYFFATHSLQLRNLHTPGGGDSLVALFRF